MVNLSIRFSFALLATHAPFMGVPPPDGSRGAKGSDTCALPSYYKLFYYVTRIELIAFHPTF